MENNTLGKDKTNKYLLSTYDINNTDQEKKVSNNYIKIFSSDKFNSPQKIDNSKHSQLICFEDKQKFRKYENEYLDEYNKSYKEIPEDYRKNIEVLSSKSTLRGELNNLDKEILELQNKLKNYV